MNKIIEKIKEKDELCIFLMFFLILLGISLNISLDASDEIWNFQNVYKMYNGFKIYEEINVIITPLFFWCAEIIFHIFSANLCVFRICHCVLMTVLCLFTYKIFKKIEVPKSVSILTILIILLQQFFILIRTGLNYNNMALLFFLIGVYFLINEKTRKNMLIQSIITILIILTKQNIGIYYLLGNIVYLAISENNIKSKIKEILKYISVIALGGILFVIYLMIGNNLYNFLNYTFEGILEFASENITASITEISFLIGIVFMNIGSSILVLKTNFFSKSQKENIKILLIFSIMLSMVCYPIFNWFHIIIGTYLMIINIVYILYMLFKEFRKAILKVTKVVSGIIIVGMFIFSFYHLYMWGYRITSNEYPYSWEDPFFGGITTQEQYTSSENVINYIETSDKNVIVFSYRAALYMTPLKRNNGDFDLPFKGNLGIKGEDGLIEEIDNMENAQFLIWEEKIEKAYQETTKAKEYIKNTKQYVGEIEGFKIYE